MKYTVSNPAHAHYEDVKYLYCVSDKVFTHVTSPEVYLTVNSEVTLSGTIP
jgi:hypothetical protein